MTNLGSSWHTYPSIFNLGHKAVSGLLSYPVIVEEKVDGSQFSFGIFDGEVRTRSKRVDITADPGMFDKALETVEAIKGNLMNGWTYRAEYLRSPRHNAATYARVPEKHLVIFDINTGHEAYLPPGWKAEEARRLGLECVPMLFQGTALTLERFEALLDTESFLGGAKIEGVVIKPAEYALFGQDKKVLMGKYVSPAFRELNHVAHKPTLRADIIEALVAELRTEARWQKAVQHLREAGVLEDSPRDIGKLMGEIHSDVEKECEDLIKARLYKHFKKAIYGGVSRGAAEWYKEQLLAAQFANAPTS